jgi:predicted transcriptional regulator
VEPSGERAKELLLELIGRGYPARMIAEYLGVHESRVSRFLKGESKRGKLAEPEALKALERLLGPEGEELFRRWVMAKLTAEVMRRLKGIGVEEARGVAARLLPARLEAYRRFVRRARESASFRSGSPPRRERS